MLDEQTERLINRRLDGELDDAERLELDKQLIRSPELRETFDELQRIDILAAETLNALLDSRGPKSSIELTAVPAWAARRRRTRRLLDTSIGIAAAVLLILVGPSLLPSRDPAPQTLPPPQGLDLAQLDTQPGIRAPVDQRSPALTEVIAGPRRQHDRIDQDVIGVVDPETQSVYLLEIQRARNTVSRVQANY